MNQTFQVQSPKETVFQLQRLLKDIGFQEAFVRADDVAFYLPNEPEAFTPDEYATGSKKREVMEHITAVMRQKRIKHVRAAAINVTGNKVTQA